jgi:hypothetical protein
MFPVEGIEIILNLRNYERVKTTERARACGGTTLLHNLTANEQNQEKTLHS